MTDTELRIEALRLARDIATGGEDKDITKERAYWFYTFLTAKQGEPQGHNPP